MVHRLRLLPRADGIPVGGVSRLRIWLGRVKAWAGNLANRLGLPGTIRPLRYLDPLTGCLIEVRVGNLFTVISVDGRDYYFRRFSGRFDGTGSGC